MTGVPMSRDIDRHMGETSLEMDEEIEMVYLQANKRLGCQELEEARGKEHSSCHHPDPDCSLQIVKE